MHNKVTQKLHLRLKYYDVYEIDELKLRAQYRAMRL